MPIFATVWHAPTGALVLKNSYNDPTATLESALHQVETYLVNENLNSTGELHVKVAYNEAQASVPPELDVKPGAKLRWDANLRWNANKLERAD